MRIQDCRKRMLGLKIIIIPQRSSRLDDFAVKIFERFKSVRLGYKLEICSSASEVKTMPRSRSYKH